MNASTPIAATLRVQGRVAPNRQQPKLSRTLDLMRATTPAGYLARARMMAVYEPSLLTNEHGGWIEVGDAPGGGARFTIGLPLTC